MNLRNSLVVGSMFAVVSGCAYLPEGYPSRTSNYESPAGLFVTDIDTDQIPVAEPKVATAPEGPGLKIRKSKRGNMESYVVRGQRYFTLDSSEGYSAKGVASWYGPNFHGRTASNGEVYDMYRLTAAHKTLPLPTYARVTHAENGRSVVVKINDRGPFSGDRIIDLSFAAALRLGMINDGTAEVEIQALSPEEMMVLSGPENKLEIDFYNTEDEPQEAAASVAQAAPAVQEELVSVAAVELDQNPITAQPIAQDSGEQPASVATVPTAAQSAVQAPVAQAVVAQADSALPSTTAADNVRISSGDPVTAEDALLTVQVDDSAAGELVATNEIAKAVNAQTNELDSELQDALMPVVADANVQGLATAPAAAVQTVPAVTDKNRNGYFIQAGVFADVADAELLAVDVVLAAPGEEVHVKPLKDSDMYRITVGPIVSSDHATKVSEMLTEAGLDNFTVRVK